MDHRKALSEGTFLPFSGFSCRVGKEIGRGSNALVYEGDYQDALNPDQIHHVLIKELFPLDSQGNIFRQEDGSIQVEPDGIETFLLHRSSFEAGNRAHLKLLETCPEQIGANLNSFSFHGTLYTLLGISGGESLEKLQKQPARSLRACAVRMLTILDSLTAFHENGLLHLDIAPDNILILGSGRRERAMLIDYNSAMSAELNPQDDSFVFSIKQGYTAPEIRSGQFRRISFSSDLYSVTAVFYRLLTGAPLTGFQMIRSAPPDVSECPCMKEEPDTVKVWVQEILRRGLRTVPSRRYQSIEQMRQDLEELIDRIDGIGITHWALWEAGRKQTLRMIRDNPSLDFLRDSASLFPAMVSDGTQSYAAEEFLRNAKENCMLLAGGGMGKTTALLHLTFAGEGQYSPNRPAVMYLSLFGWQADERSFILNRLLDGLHFRSDTHTFEDARKALREVLDQPLKNPSGQSPALLLLLDGLNELSGDIKPLLDEIRELSTLQGIRLVVASRTEETSLPFIPLHLTELSDEAIHTAIEKAGLLFPESVSLQNLLRTPLMLSMYLRAGQAGRHSQQLASADDLLHAYFSSLKEKAVQDLPEETGQRWQTEAAMELVLPAIANEMVRRRRALTDQELLPIVEKCYVLLNGHLSRRFFPQWIGRTTAIRGSARNGEEWYGQIVHHLLWKQLGLLIRDDQERYLVSHQMISDYLLDREKENRQKVRRYHGVRSLLAALCVCLVLCTGILVWKNYLAPQPYKEAYAENIMSRIGRAYVSAGQQYESLADLTDAALYHPESFPAELMLFHQAYPAEEISSEQSLLYLSAMLETGQVMPWSGKPMDEKACRKLFTLAESRKEEYDRFAAILEFVMTDDSAFRQYGSEYPQLLHDLLETDAEITAELFLAVCKPHLTGKYAGHSLYAESFSSLIASAPRQNKHLEGKDDEQAWERTTQLEGERHDQRSKLYSCGAFHATP